MNLVCQSMGVVAGLAVGVGGAILHPDPVSVAFAAMAIAGSLVFVLAGPIAKVISRALKEEGEQ